MRTGTYGGRQLPRFVSTTILGVSHKGRIALGGDGQVTMNETIVKCKANKIRRMYHDTILTGFAGAAADAFTLFDQLESHLEKHQGNLPRAAVELARVWRTDKYLRTLQALLAVFDHDHSLIISGSGDVIEPDDGIVAVGSGAPYALAAARALVQYSSLGAREIVQEALKITSGICIHTNDSLVIEEL